MKKIILILVTGLFLLAACSPSRKAQTINKALGPDTSKTVLVEKIDSALIVKEIVAKVNNSKIDFQTFNAKIKVDYQAAESSDTYTIYLSMRKDSIILIKLTGSVLGIRGLGFQAKIKKDSVILVQYAGEQSVKYRSINFLQEVTQIPFDFNTLQDLFIGNPIFLDPNMVSYRWDDNHLLILMVGKIFKHLLTLDTKDFLPIHSKLDDADLQRNRTADISFGNYQPMGNYLFATSREITIAEKRKLDINLDFKEYSLNEPLKYNFEVPKKFKRK